MQIKSGTVDINLIHQFFYRDFFNIFLLHQSGKTGAKLCTGFSYPAIHFFSFFRFHKNPPFIVSPVFSQRVFLVEKTSREDLKSYLKKI